MIALGQRRLLELLCDPAVFVIAALLLTIAFLQSRLSPIDLQNLAGKSGLDLLFHDLWRYRGSHPGTALTAGCALFATLAYSLLLAIQPHALEVPEFVTDRARGQEVRFEMCLGQTLSLSGLLVLLLLPLVRLSQDYGTPDPGQNMLLLTLILMLQSFAISAWAGLWTSAAPTRLSQRLAVGLGPLCWTVPLILTMPRDYAWAMFAIQPWANCAALIVFALLCKLRLWERALPREPRGL